METGLDTVIWQLPSAHASGVGDGFGAGAAPHPASNTATIQSAYFMTFS
jgi:hypothetical protein